MPPKQGTGTDPARPTPVPADGDGEELIGTVIDGRYKLDGTLGRGGMGLVYRATHVNLRRQAAVKILHPSLAASLDVRNRFEREALASGKIDHPNCVAVYDSGHLPDGSLYLAMELLDGRSLADVLEQEGQLAPGRALHILGHILRGLGNIHQAGLIHRDIKPENIFLIRHGQDEDFAKILDFGIAKPMRGELSDDGVKLTQAGMAFGTPIYMAPEQALGNPLDGRADLYAAAVLGYEMLTGQPPFYSDDKLEVMSMHTARPVPPMRQRLIKGGRPVPSSIEKLIVRGLTKKPSDRYANAEVFLAAVEEALRTPDGGVTDVSFERPSNTTGSQALVTESGDLVPDLGIQDAIEQVLAAPTPPKVATPPRGARTSAQTLPPPPQPSSPPVPVPSRQSASSLPLGGVGIGLPFTGPAGEPVFGLTPEQRLEPRMPAVVPAAKKKRWPIYAAIGAAAIIAGVAIAIATMPRGGDEPKLEPGSPTAQAADAVDHDPAKAVQILEDNKATIGNDPIAQRILGHAHATLRKNLPAALAAYQRALQLSPTIEADTALRGDLRAIAGERDDVDLVAHAFALWAGMTQDPEARAALLKAAVSEDIHRRQAVRPLIDQLKIDDQVNWLAAYSLDLAQDEPCEKRQAAVARLRALGDPGAIPALQRAAVRRGRTGSKKGPNACLLDDAASAVSYLKSLHK